VLYWIIQCLIAQTFSYEAQYDISGFNLYSPHVLRIGRHLNLRVGRGSYA